MTAPRVFFLLSAILCEGSVLCNRREGPASTRMLFLAYCMLANGVLAELASWGLL